MIIVHSQSKTNLESDEMRELCPNLETVPRCIEYHLNQNPDARCCSLFLAGKEYSYTREQFWNYASRYATLFASIASPQLIIFIKKTDIHLLAAYVGAMLAAHLPAQISPPSDKTSKAEYERKISHIKEITGFGALFTDAEETVRYTDTSAEHVFSPDDLPAFSGYIDSLKNEEALVQFSSGSTGLQKGVVLTHKNIISHMRNYGDVLQLLPTDSIVSWLPLYHDMGLMACYLMPLMCGIPFYQMDPFEWILQPNLLLRVVEEKKPSICFLPNFAYHVLTQKGRPHDLSSIRLWINCSEPARLESHKVFLEKFPSVHPEALTVCYALAENTFAVSQTLPWHNNSTRHLHNWEKILSCGRPIKDVEVKIFSSDSVECGEIGLKSPTLFNRFLNGSSPFIEGFYLTGDLGFIDDQGEIFITGRKKDVIIVNGKNVFPQDVEQVASNVPGVYPGRVVALGIWDDVVGSESLVVLAESNDEVTPTSLKLAILKTVMEEIGITPKRVEILEHMSLVKTSSGKLSRSRNKELYQAKELNLL
jgi:acyl-CoA synthetase (AMP-forming)/AMP-acid ligase II